MPGRSMIDLKLFYLFDVEFYRANGKTCPHCMQQPYQMCNSRLYKSCIINVEEWPSWLKAAVLKTVRLERVSGVRIPPPPPPNVA